MENVYRFLKVTQMKYLVVNSIMKEILLLQVQRIIHVRYGEKRIGNLKSECQQIIISYKIVNNIRDY